MEFEEKLLKIYKEYIEFFNNYNFNGVLKNENDIINIYYSLTDFLEKNNIIEKHGIKKHKIVKTGEII